MDVHHVKPIRECEDWQEANELSNLVSLCNPCHLKVRGTNGIFRLRLL
jgi:predicted HNH restriction endonuclease